MPDFSLTPMVALIAGIIILVAPRFLSIVLGLYLIFVGLTGLFPDILNSLKLQ